MYPDQRIHNPYMMGYGYPSYGMGYPMMGYSPYGMMHYEDPCCGHYQPVHYQPVHYHPVHHHHEYPHNTQMQAQAMSLNIPGRMYI